jgi:PKD repeat protein
MPRIRSFVVRFGPAFLAGLAPLILTVLPAYTQLAQAAEPPGAPLPADVELSRSPSVRATAVSTFAPVLDPLSAMSVRGGLVADQLLYASDADGDPVTFSKILGPSYMTVTTLDPGTGGALGNVHLTPTFSDAGPSTGIVAASDGSLTDQKSFSIMVLSILSQPADMTLNEGATADQALLVSDPDHAAYTFSMVGGPRFMAVATTSDSTGNVHLAPGYADAGVYGATVSVAGGVGPDEKSFMIRVNNVNRSPVLLQPADMVAVAGMLSVQGLAASDPDVQPLTFYKVSGPGYVSVSAGKVRVLPAKTDAGVAAATVAVTDGIASDQKSFAIQVDLVDHDPVWAPLRDMDLAEGAGEDQLVPAYDVDRQQLFFSVSGLPRFMSLSTVYSALDGDSVVERIRLLPSYSDAGTYHPTLTVSDGRYQATATLNITIRDAYPGETSLRLRAAHRGQGGDEVDYEYSAVDGSYAVSNSGQDLVVLQFRARAGSNAAWTLGFRAPPGSALVEGTYENVPIGTPAVGPWFVVTGSDSNALGLTGCPGGRATFTIKSIARRIDGSIGSLWATFHETCSDSGTVDGDVCYQAQSVPITLVAPRWLLLYANEETWFEASAVDTAHDAIAISASGVPSGARYVDFGVGIGRVGWTPSTDQQGDYLIRFIASSAGGLADTALTSIHVGSRSHPPVARINGPYDGTIGVPIPFTSAGSRDPDGDVLSYHWTFGDGALADEPAPTHSYKSVGPYPVSLLVSDGTLSGGDNTLAVISERGSARVFRAGGTGPLRLEAGGGRFCVAMEVGAGLRSREDVDLASIQLRAQGFGSISAIAPDSASVAVGDADQNGVSDFTACFSRHDLRDLFSNVTGSARDSVTIEVSLRDGHGWRGSLPIEVIGPERALSVLVAPNPINPIGMFSFVTTVGGAARVRLFDHAGKSVRTLLHATNLGPGYHDVPIDGRDERGGRLPSGVYYYRLETAEGSRTGRIAIVK